MSVRLPALRKGLVIRSLALLTLLVAGYLVTRYTPLGDELTEERIISGLQEIQAIGWAPFALLALYILLAPTGFAMMVLVTVGAIFGPIKGSIINTTGLVLGALFSFWLVQKLGREMVVQITGKRFRRAERALRRHGFWPLVQTRFLPLPFAAVNFAAALAGIPARQFALAALLGLAPSTILHSWYISRLIYSSGDQRLEYGIEYFIVFAIFNLVLLGLWIRSRVRRRNRYRQLRESRSS